jgi:hypothetical protein
MRGGFGGKAAMAEAIDDENRRVPPSDVRRPVVAALPFARLRDADPGRLERFRLGWRAVPIPDSRERRGTARLRKQLEPVRLSRNRAQPVPPRAAVEKPSRAACSTSVMPGPRSSASTSIAWCAPPCRSDSSTSPSRACLTRLVASSDTTRATWPARDSSKPSFSDIVVAARRTTDTCEGSVTTKRSVFIAIA